MQSTTTPITNSRDHESSSTLSKYPTRPVSHPISQLALFAAKMPSTSVNSFCGAMAGMASGIVTCPLDVIKTKLQAQGSFAHQQRNNRSVGAASKAIYHGLFGTAKTVVKQDGFLGLYRGLGPMLLGYLPTWAVYMAVYDSSRDYYYNQIDNKFLSRVLASITAGGCSTLATNPIWVIKTRLMSQVSSTANESARTPWHYHNTWDAARKMLRNEGIASFYSGLSPALLGLTHVAIQFPLYEYFKTQFTGLEMGEVSSSNNTNFSTNSSSSSSSSSSNTIGILAATFLSKVCATSATYPHEVLRTRLQTQQRPHSQSPHSSPVSSTLTNSVESINETPKYKGIIKTCRIILQEEGWRAFYNGMGTNMIRAVPAAMTTMLTFETLKGVIVNLQEEGRGIESVR